ncbi:MAG: hypothetical protein AAGJ97_01510 [Planctomycetota bacterium]
MKSLIDGLGAEGFYRRVCKLLNEKTLTVEDFSYRELAEACGVLPELRRLNAVGGPEGVETLRESNPGVSSSLFKTLTGELLGRKVIEGYESEAGFVGDRLVTVLPTTSSKTRLSGVTALAGPTEVAEGHPYEESNFAAKYVTTDESKRGRILSVNEELIGLDQSGEINRRASQLGYYLRQERERTILRGVTDADAGGGAFVYRPSGVGESLYRTDGSHRNYIGAGNTTSADFNQAVPLVDWTDVDTAMTYRATEVLDDRVDGTPRPIVNPARQLLVPESLRGTARAIAAASEVTLTNADGQTTLANPVGGMLEVLSSPFLDEAGVAGRQDWYVGDFPRQFVWTEIWPVQTFLQNAESNAAFERDVVLRVKVRYYGGISAVDTAFVTKVDGAA